MDPLNGYGEGKKNEMEEKLFVIAFAFFFFSQMFCVTQINFAFTHSKRFSSERKVSQGNAKISSQEGEKCL